MNSSTLRSHTGLILAAIAALMLLLALLIAGHGAMQSRRVARALERAAEMVPPDAGGDRKDEKRSKAELPAEMKKLLADRPIFGRPPDQEPRLESIFAGAALINGNWMKPGETSGDIKLLEIGTYGVTIHWKGDRRELTLWSELPGAGSSENRERQNNANRRNDSSSQARRARSVEPATTSSEQ